MKKLKQFIGGIICHFMGHQRRKRVKIEGGYRYLECPRCPDTIKVKAKKPKVIAP